MGVIEPSSADGQSSNVAIPDISKLLSRQPTEKALSIAEQKVLLKEGIVLSTSRTDDGVFELLFIHDAQLASCIVDSLVLRCWRVSSR